MLTRREAKAPKAWLRLRIPMNFAARPRPAAFLWYSCFFHCITHRTKRQRNFAQGKHAASRRIMLDADCSHRDQALPEGSGYDAVDLQISLNYVYQSGKHTDSFFLSADSHWASQMFEPKTRSYEWNRVRARSFHLPQLNTQLDVVFCVRTWQLFYQLSFPNFWLLNQPFHI